jgi:hypothetical protein
MLDMSCIQERNNRHGELMFATTPVSAHSKIGVSAELIRQIVQEEQEIMDSGIDVEAAMAQTHREDRERYKSAREKLADQRREDKIYEKEFFKKQAADAAARDSRAREHRMPPPRPAPSASPVELSLVESTL